MSTNAVDITLMGRSYSIACPAGQEKALKLVAHNIEQQLTQLKSRTNSLSREDLLVMAALNIGHELLSEKTKNQEYMEQMDDRIRVLQSTLEQALVERSDRHD
ncbi:cell division protein ZapA [Shewanella sp.]|uniref:cell division protein ZapA n=1 Tax=Shewanella sp. TaxID=50422 RepID=UPI003A97069F